MKIQQVIFIMLMMLAFQNYCVSDLSNWVQCGLNCF